MDIIQTLPFPDEVCNKIFIFWCKSPHTGLGVEIFKKKLQTNDLNIPENDDDVIKLFRLREIKKSYKSIDIDLFTCFHNLTVIYLSNIRVSGDIAHMKSLPNLTIISLVNTGVSGDIAHLKSLPNLTIISLVGTGVSGDIEHLKSLPKLTTISLSDTGVSGDIEHLKSLPELECIDLSDTGVSGDILHLKSLPNLWHMDLRWTEITVNKVNRKKFHKYRKNAGLRVFEFLHGWSD